MRCRTGASTGRSLHSHFSKGIKAEDGDARAAWTVMPSTSSVISTKWIPSWTRSAFSPSVIFIVSAPSARRTRRCSGNEAMCAARREWSAEESESEAMVGIREAGSRMSCEGRDSAGATRRRAMTAQRERPMASVYTSWCVGGTWKSCWSDRPPPPSSFQSLETSR